MNAAASARRHKERHPERYCAAHGCLWREVKGDPSGLRAVLRFPCPRHTRRAVVPPQRAD